MKAKSNRLGLSIIGCGRVAAHYVDVIKAYKLFEKFKFDACLDSDQDKAKSFAHQLNGQHFYNLADLIFNTKSDLYLVLTPSGSHFEIAEALLRSGKNVLVEKPGTLIIEESEQLIKLSTSKSLFLGCVHQNRFNVAIKAAQEILNKNKLGRILHFSVRLRWSRKQDYYNDGWHGTWQLDGGVVSQQAFHHLDALRFLLGEVESVFSMGSKMRHKLEAEDTCVAVLKMESGAIGTFEATTTILDFDQEASIEIFGEKGHLSIGGIAMNQILNFSSTLCNPLEIKKMSNVSEHVKSGYGNGHYAVLQSVWESLTNREKEYDVSWSESIKTLQLIHSVYASQELNQKIYTREKIKSSKLGRGTKVGE